uniref:RNA methyltransferase n=1 Tax=Panagrolaimus sp. JU765 TaxID=591449 RepID=A0AC34R2P5_9BILA
MKIESVICEDEVISRKRKIASDTDTDSLPSSSKLSKKDSEVEESSEPAQKSKKEKQQELNAKFRYGNFHRYYGSRLKGSEKDSRLEVLNKDWFRRKNVLDIGCNAGYLTLAIAKDFDPGWILGIDIDSHLVGVCRKNIKHYVDDNEEIIGDFPASLVKNEEEGGPIIRKFPNNVWFRTQNYVPEFEEQIEQTNEEYDVILALSITKWIHLNWGDDGIRKFFRRVFRHLRPGGRFILETQPFGTYYKRAKTVPELKEVYKKLELKPDQFQEYLLKEVGFETCEDLGVPKANSKGFERPLQVFRKGFMKTKNRNQMSGGKTLDVDFEPCEAFDFSNVARNIAMVECGMKAPTLRSTGTTIVASIFKDGVVMGADSRATAGNIIADKQCEKVHKLTDSIYACGAGTAADLDQVTKMLSSNLRLIELNTGKKARVITAMRQAKQHLFNYQGYIGAYLLIGGVDDTGAYVYDCSAEGTTMAKPYDADGSGSYAAISVLERGFKFGMTEEEAKDLVQRALHAGMHGDNASGNSLNLVVITKEGAKFEGPIVPDFCQRPENIELEYKFKPGATTVLKQKVFKYDVIESMDIH